MKKTTFILALILSLLASALPVAAQETNQFGIHILEPNEINQAADLINSNGGDWGFVTIVIRDDDQNPQKWQSFFDQCRQQHLVPLVRLATHNENESWAAPKKENIDRWVNFLNNLNWPVKKRYVIIFNEPNHTKEWGKEINPQEYTQILAEFIKELKQKNENFQILSAGFDLAAPNSKTTMDAYYFWQEMNREIPGIFNQLDGWASHSYPNHGFIGKPNEIGRTSIRGYQWELSILKNYFGIKKELPVFITETGWPHNSPKSKVQSPKYYDPEITAQYIEVAYKNVWLKDKRIIAVTPFTLNYHAEPLSVFSWIDSNGQPHPQYERIKNLPKKSWWPQQEEKWEIMNIKYPQFMPINSKYQGEIILKNTGQSIWGEKIFSFPSNSPAITDLKLPKDIRINPGEIYQFEFAIQGPNMPKEIHLSWENIDQNINIVCFNPVNISSYKTNFFQKIISILKVWWYDKIS
ncbi:hypothetical protein COT63_00890 [Candidatus Shapirobacteria bacterium CG09_land_8_20_14_0_10_38_17]|uniref:Asl1-like glycosyl hydrolase catalytic domain-containing protein n=1 Tax=Candidatus Shapirobacteria bacterium CG09_land_8_20_14_0_10_38_17 TaxID=1974884 RepID=A0A2H0WTM4_9BACT|nr:MAG: hypothetical protein COT63_00890 [Candidatus Shapirobacteria bacterium CG09_land_8_20_14_0_10_38_17]